MSKLIQGDCLDVLKTLDANSVDSVITDPPAGISFMGKSWDSDKGGREQWIGWMSQVMSECLRVLKPGAHGLVWAIPRTSHWTATALENAGFEVRDVVTHLFGSGFPKSMDISKAIDKQAGAKREVIGLKDVGPDMRGGNFENADGRMVAEITSPATDAAKQWAGFGTALKPAAEFWVLVRKPLSEKTVAANVLRHGTGGINIDECRIGTNEVKEATSEGGKFAMWNPEGTNKGFVRHNGNGTSNPQGRFPANLVLDEEAAAMLDGQSGDNVSRFFKTTGHRFIYVAKASKKDKGETNTHPTVKSTKLMEYLITLITPPNGVILDPFMGSGSTGVAAKRLGFSFIGIEQDAAYLEIAKKRIGE